jgi:hypothetical protein
VEQVLVTARRLSEQLGHGVEGELYGDLLCEGTLTPLRLFLEACASVEKPLSKLPKRKATGQSGVIFWQIDKRRRVMDTAAALLRACHKHSRIFRRLAANLSVATGGAPVPPYSFRVYVTECLHRVVDGCVKAQIRHTDFELLHKFLNVGTNLDADAMRTCICDALSEVASKQALFAFDAGKEHGGPALSESEMNAARIQKLGDELFLRGRIFLSLVAEGHLADADWEKLVRTSQAFTGPGFKLTIYE